MGLSRNSADISRVRQKLLFLLVGLFSALIYYVTVALLYEAIGADYRIAVSMGYVLSVLSHFFANRNITFQADGGKLISQIPRYLTLVVINYLLTLAIVTVAVEVLSMSPYLAVAVAIVTTMVVSYLLMRHWIFARAT